MSDIVQAKHLTVEQQLTVLQRVRERLIKRDFIEKKGLCELIDIEYAAFMQEIGALSCFYCFRCSFPYFHRYNASAFNASQKGVFWWKRKPYDYKNRIAFVNWMISKI